MVNKIHSLLDTLQLSAAGCFFVLRQWKYLLITVISSIFIAGLLHFIINSSSIWPLLSSPLLTFFDKALILIDLPLLAVANNGPLILAMSLLQGVAIALLAFNMRASRLIDKKSASGSVIASTIAAIGLGCSVCGTSLLLPIIGLFGSASIYAKIDIITGFISALALIVIILSIVRLGVISYANTKSREYQQSKPTT